MRKMNRKLYCSQIRVVQDSSTLRQEDEERKEMRRMKMQKPMKYLLLPILVAVLICALLFENFFPTANSSVTPENLMAGITPHASAAAVSMTNDQFFKAQADFSVKLLQKTEKKGKNCLVSPLSVASALAMTANGSSGETLRQFETLLGEGIALDDLNRGYAEMGNRLTGDNSKLKSANSIWYGKGRVSVKKEFLQRNADYYGAGAYQLDFSKADTVSRINGWVKDHTGGKIEQVIQQIDPENVMYLINALDFEDDWAHPYYPYGEKDYEEFSTPNGKVKREFMGSFEDYIHDDGTEGMIKPFKDKRYAFAAILPKEETDLNDYINSLTGEKFLNLMHSKEGSTQCLIPKFKYDYQVNLKMQLIGLGLVDAFDLKKADFSQMGTSPDGPLFIGDVLHKTFIQVDEAGAKAGAVTVVTMASGSAPMDHKKIVFNRPFVYAVIDTQTNLPVFLGTVTDPVQ